MVCGNTPECTDKYGYMQVNERLLFCYFSSDSYFHNIWIFYINNTQHLSIILNNTIMFMLSDRFLNICIILHSIV